MLPKEPARRLAVLTCMDARLDPLAQLGLAVGDAHVLRNGGATVTDDVERSLEVSRALGVTEVMVVGHTDCAAFPTGVDEAVRASVAAIERLGFESVRGYVYDLAAERLDPVGA